MNLDALSFEQLNNLLHGCCRERDSGVGRLRCKTGAGTMVAFFASICFFWQGTLSAQTGVNIEERLIPTSRVWRLPNRTFVPKFITIHSTDNSDTGANAIAHANLLASKERFPSESKLSRTGFRSWHFTVDDIRTIQHLPINEQGDHADFTGPGNQSSLGIEICVNRDGNKAKALEKAAALTSYLMKRLTIDLDHVVPHYYWAQPPKDYHKPCPGILMDNEKPGKKWMEFKKRIQQFRDRLRSQ